MDKLSAVSVKHNTIYLIHEMRMLIRMVEIAGMNSTLRNNLVQALELVVDFLSDVNDQTSKTK